MGTRDNSEVREEQSIHMEHSEDYKRQMKRITESLWDKVFCMEPVRPEEIAEWFSEDFFWQELQESIGKNLMLFRLYAANGIGMLTEEAKRRSLPAETVEHVKRTAFVEIADAQDKEQVSETVMAAAGMMNRLYRKYRMDRYSYLVCCAAELIHRKKFEPAAPGGIADALQCDRTYLAKRFRLETGKTLTEYIREVKMGTAVYLMSMHTYSLLEISEMLGYSGYTLFSRNFHRYYGVSPEYYRKNADKECISS